MAKDANRLPLITPTGHVLLRLLISSYFIAAATGAVSYPAGRAFMALLVPTQLADLAFTVFLFATAWLILIDRQMRGAALVLALFIFWAGYMASFGPGAFRGVEAFWRDLALIGGLLMIYPSRAAATKTQEGTPPARPKSHAAPALRTACAVKTAPAHGRAAFKDDPDTLATAFSRVIELPGKG